MAENAKFYRVKNRSGSHLSYTLPEDRIRREFAPGEVKRISFEELQKLTWQAGGSYMLDSYLQLEPEAVEELDMQVEPEYHMSEQQIIELMKTGTPEEFEDCLTHAPVGIIELIKDYAPKLPLSSYEKKQILKNITGFDVDKVINNIEAEKADDGEAAAAAKPNTRKAAVPNYTVVKTTAQPTKTVSKIS